MRTRKRTTGHTGRTTTALLNNKTMNDDTYQQRRQVMAFIYIAKIMLKNVGYDLPRIDVRIATRPAGSRVAGVARLGSNIIWIEEGMLTSPWLRRVVWHEMLHAVKATPHDEKCPLMSPVINTIVDDEKIDNLFIQYMTK